MAYKIFYKTKGQIEFSHLTPAVTDNPVKSTYDDINEVFSVVELRITGPNGRSYDYEVRDD